MAVTFTWGSTYENLPGAALARSMIDNELRAMRRGVREIMEIEHNWGQYTDIDDGSHGPGRVTVMLKGDAAVRDALTDVQEGALYFLSDSGTIELYIYTSGAWVKTTDIDHASFSNLLADSHVNYLKKDLTDAMTEALDMGGYDIVNASPPAAGYDSHLIYGNHEALQHSVIGNNDAILDDTIKYRHLTLTQHPLSGSLTEGQEIDILFDSVAFMFFPNFYASTTDVRVRSVTSFSKFGFGLKSYGSSANYRVNCEVLS